MFVIINRLDINKRDSWNAEGNAINSMEECRTDFINHIRVCLSLCVCVCVFQYSIRVFLHRYIYSVFIPPSRINIPIERGAFEFQSQRKLVEEFLFAWNQSIGRFRKNRETDWTRLDFQTRSSPIFFLSIRILRILRSRKVFEFRLSISIRFFIIRREIREFSFFKGGGGGIRVHSSRVERSYWIGKFSAQQGSWEDGRQLARLGSFSRRWQPVPGEIFYLKKGMEIFLSLRTRKNKFVGYPPPPTARYFLVFRPTLSGDLVTWWNKEWRIQGTFEDFLRARGEQIYPLNLHITENFGKFLISRDT